MHTAIRRNLVLEYLLSGSEGFFSSVLDSCWEEYTHNVFVFSHDISLQLMALEAIYGDDLIEFESKAGLRYFQVCFVGLQCHFTSSWMLMMIFV